MWTFMLLGLLCASASASAIQARSSSYSGEYGSGRGEPFSHAALQLQGPITAIRVRVDSFNIAGLTMWTFMLLGLLCASASASAIQARSSSYNGEYGSGGGERFSHSGLQLEGPITAIRVRVNSLYIVGLQVRYGKVWSDYVGGKLGDLEEIFLHPGESVIQVSGKYKYYLRKLVFVTDKGRYLSFGKDTGTSFNAVPLHPNTVLRFISGRAGLFINAIGLHWDNYPRNC
uniref:Zymogen granule membrane protein 16 n=1 Tax=Oryctolagus cuniculus TaxID=9986 RepID=A0A5F9DNE3_RABIT